MSEMVDRITARMKGFFDLRCADPGPVVGFTPEEVVREAMAEMREPTEAMVRAIPKGCSFPYKDKCGLDAYRAMIDEALK